jgi:SAM-dependent methyltransferase
MAGPISSIMQAMHKPIYESRLRELVRTILPHLRAEDRILDVGCGNGTLGKALMDGAPGKFVAEGLERAVRGGEPIKVHAYDGVKIPFADNAYDIVIVADVLHHEPDPDRLMRECARVAKRAVIVKDHQVAGLLAQQRISFMDWAANAPYSIPCLYRYNSPSQWDQFPAKFGLKVGHEVRSMNVYPPIVNTIFGGRLHYLGVLVK